MPYQLILPPLLFAGPFCLALGLTLPLVRFEKLYFFEETPSLIGIIVSLWNDGDALLAILVALLSAVFPVAKLLVVLSEAVGRQSGEGRLTGPLGKLIPLLSKWSMMDVLLVALVIVAAKTSGVADAFTQPGLWFYAASALLVTLTHALLQRRSRQSKQQKRLSQVQEP
ncbi:MAG: paraquat-inducible protein A [Pseudomonadota bacterium]